MNRLGIDLAIGAGVADGEEGGATVTVAAKEAEAICDFPVEVSEEGVGGGRLQGAAEAVIGKAVNGFADGAADKTCAIWFYICAGVEQAKVDVVCRLKTDLAGEGCGSSEEAVFGGAAWTG